MVSETEKEDIAVTNYQHGFLEGMEKKAIETARNLKALRVEPAIVAQATGLSEEQINAL